MGERSDFSAFDIHPAAPLAIASGAAVLAGLDVASGLLAVGDDEAYLFAHVSSGLRLFAALCLVAALVAALLSPARRGLQAAGVVGVAIVAMAVEVLGSSLIRDAGAVIP